MDEKHEVDEDYESAVPDNEDGIDKNDPDQEDLNCIPDYNSVGINLNPDAVDDDGGNVPDLVSEAEGRPSCNTIYDPSTGWSYAQIERCHNLVTLIEDLIFAISYEEIETKVVANIITHFKVKCYAQQFMLKKGCSYSKQKRLGEVRKDG